MDSQPPCSLAAFRAAQAMVRGESFAIQGDRRATAWRGAKGRGGRSMASAHRAPADLDRLVLEQLRASNRALGAYAIAQRSRRTPSPLAPNQVYRILNRLIERGIVRRVELLSAYICIQPGQTGVAVCRNCRTVAAFEADVLSDPLESFCRARGFAPSKAIIEVSGLCPHCHPRRTGAAPLKDKDSHPARLIADAFAPASPIHHR